MALKDKFKFEFSSGIENVGVWLSVFLLSGVIFVILKSLLIPKPEAELNFNRRNITMELAIPAPKKEGPNFAELTYDETISLAALTKKQNTPLTRVSHPLDDGWDYGSSSKKGPRAWASLRAQYESCKKGRNQSPINIRIANRQTSLLPLDLTYPEIISLKAYNNGRIPRFSVDEAEAAKILFHEREYYLQYIDVHFPSEHLIAGEKSDMEIQLVHQALSGEVLVLSMLGREKLKGTPELGALLASLPKSGQLPPVAKSLKLKSLVGQPREYYAYNGSLTHPPCDEDVQWLVLAKRLDVAADWTDEFVRRVGFNARGLQSLNDRKVGKSF